MTMLDSSKTVLITGAAGFIGFQLARRLLEDGVRVLGVDSLNDYYSVSLKADRVRLLEESPQFRFISLDLSAVSEARSLFEEHSFSYVVHLAAQAGVRYSLEHPHAYITSNLVGFANVLEGCRRKGVEHFLYASSSSVYGETAEKPFSVQNPAEHPVSLYAATKRSDELMAHSYSHLYGVPSTGLRFFTVYGPWGRPDMAYWTFTQDILEGKRIRLFNNGRMLRDFTYVQDVIDSLVRLLPIAPEPSMLSSLATSPNAPWRILNIGNSDPIPLDHFVDTLERAIGRPAAREYLPMQPGDVTNTHADVSELEALIGPLRHTSLEEGLPIFVDWFVEYHSHSNRTSRL